MGARQLVVQEALETKVMSEVYFLWLTPMTNMGVSSLEGAPMTTCLAPASMWPWHSSLVRCLPVHSHDILGAHARPGDVLGLHLR